jgi:hypothetical protein
VRVWNGVDLETRTPELGMRLDLADLIPEFAAQFLESGLCVETDRLLITPLDDLKAWLRTLSPGEPGLRQEIRDLLLAQEEIDMAKALKAGEKFDPVDYELSQMASDESYEQFDVAWTKKILALALDEADVLQDFNAGEFHQDFTLAVSFTLPDPRKHPLFKPMEIEENLRKFGAEDKLVARALKAQGRRVECTGALLLEFYKRGRLRGLKSVGSTGFVGVGLGDSRAGDATDVDLSLAYPLELEGYFLQTFDQLRKQLTLKDES